MGNATLPELFRPCGWNSLAAPFTVRRTRGRSSHQHKQKKKRHQTDCLPRTHIVTFPAQVKRLHLSANPICDSIFGRPTRLSARRKVARRALVRLRDSGSRKPGLFPQSRERWRCARNPSRAPWDSLRTSRVARSEESSDLILFWL